MTESIHSDNLVNPSHKTLLLEFPGRVIEHLGIQMYQSPVNAIAELVANAWDADATTVDIELPQASTDPEAVFQILDNGIGMKFDDCQDFFLAVGCNRREEESYKKSQLGRSVLGRKGIGKFAGFGVARVMTVRTISKETGERTVFSLDLDVLSAQNASTIDRKEIRVLEYDPPELGRRSQHGTVITLSKLRIHRAPSEEQFRQSMARRFLLHEEQADFTISVQGEPLPQSFDVAGFEYQFPLDLPKLQNGIVINTDGWGIETVEGHEIRWRFLFQKETIEEEELRGVAVFARGKLAQMPFFFNLTHGLTGRHGTEYLAGQVVADFIDQLPSDLISTERQRINWDREETAPLLDWAQGRLKQVLRIWAELRAEEKRKRLEERLVGFATRLNRLQKHERKTVEQALIALGKVPTLSEQQYDELGQAILTAWEHGRLKGLIAEIAEAEDLNESTLLDVLMEARILTALQTVEVVRTKLEAIQNLRLRIEKKDLENSIRDFIAQNPWLISPEWETFKKETSLQRVTGQAAGTSKLLANTYRGRVDLTMSSGRHLLVIEFVRPGQTVDWDHLSRFERYVLTIRSAIMTSTEAVFRSVTGYIIADHLDKNSDSVAKIQLLAKDDMYALDWHALLEKAEAGWSDFLNILEERGSGDFRMEEHFVEARLNGS
ncbi:MAG: ATP-binding protein [Bacteroidetes bacterium]|nr:ATP-binding protein [Bacteroidota bacterium]